MSTNGRYTGEAYQLPRAARAPDGRVLWTYYDYWNAVLGANRNALDVVRDFDLKRDGLDTWLDAAEERAWFAGGDPGPMPDEWEHMHERALHELKLAMLPASPPDDSR
jgi:hypothetical protein